MKLNELRDNPGARKERKRIRKKRRLRRARRELEAKANRKVVYRLADLPPDLDNDARAEE